MEKWPKLSVKVLRNLVFFQNLDFHRENFALTNFVTQVTNVFRHPRVYNSIALLSDTEGPHSRKNERRR